MLADEPSIGTIIDGRFELRERLGSGAMGVVYRACQLSIDRDVAVKVLRSLDEDALKRFVREAKISSALAHPNTVQIVEFGQLPAGGAYLAMELVRGMTLLSVMDDGPLPLSRTIRIGTQLCDALEAAHRLGIVHRDLKPENIMIASDGSDHIKVLDFGIARILGDPSMTVTTTGLVAGTPHYMPPEVMTHAADPVPPQDMYALGVILAELSLGETLWAGVTTLNMLLIAKMKNTALERVAPRLRPIVMRLMHEDPAKRLSPAETRTRLHELERTATDPAGIAQTAQSMQGLASLDLVALDAHRDAPTPAPAPGVTAEPPPLDLDLDRDDPLAAFGPSAASAPNGNLSLEVDGTWAAEREARIAGRSPTKPSPQAQRFLLEHAAHARKHHRSTGIAIVGLVLIAAIGGGVYFTTFRPKQDAASTQKRPSTHDSIDRTRVLTPVKLPTAATDVPPAKQPEIAERGGVSIRIVGPAGTPITIDGKPVGKVPLSLKRSPGTRPILIEGPGVVKQIVPDHSQTVDLSR